MNVDGTHIRTIWLANDGWAVEIIDQTKLPHLFSICRLETMECAAKAIKCMLVRGAPLIGATAAYGIALATRSNPDDDNLQKAYNTLIKARPTAINLRWALLEMLETLMPLPVENRMEAAYKHAKLLCDQDVENCRLIVNNGSRLIEEIAQKTDKTKPVNILTHCNAGWLAAVDWGTALAPIYVAHDRGVNVHVWVDETRPRNQGASLTAWELNNHGVPCTLIADNAGGHLMQQGMVDLCITGSDRTTINGDVCNKIGTYLKALAADACQVPFYVALPSTTIDWDIEFGKDIPIEQRDEEEVLKVSGIDDTGVLCCIRIAPENCHAANYAFDVTPAHLITGLITERGLCDASKAGLLELYPERN